MSLSGHPDFEIVTSPICLAIAFYFSEKKCGTSHAKKKIEILSRKIGITAVNFEITHKTIENNPINDFEDGLQYYSAENDGCICIVTEDINDFYFSEIEVLQTRFFMEKYVLK